jgi:16S rRNA (guanine966-N2)-methyltransferase
LDLYAGTGSFGLECLSRGSGNVCFVEKSKEVIKILEKNIHKLKFQKKTEILSNNIFDILKKNNFFKCKFDLIFCDPPFKDVDISKLINKIFHRNILKKGGIIVIHRKKSTDETFSNFFKIIDERIYGVSKIIFGKFLF